LITLNIQESRINNVIDDAYFAGEVYTL